jgi:hypothetical protein
MSQNVWATIMPFGPVTNFLLAQNFFPGQPFQALLKGEPRPKIFWRRGLQWRGLHLLFFYRSYQVLLTDVVVIPRWASSLSFLYLLWFTFPLNWSLTRPAPLTQRIIMIYWTWWYSLIAHVCLHQLITNWFVQIVQTATYMETKKACRRGEVNVITI